MHFSKLGNNRLGTSLIELAVGMLIGSIVISSAYKTYQYVTVSVNRENAKARLQHDITTMSNFLERDIRMAGLGLPGNGVSVTLQDTASDKLHIFQNELCEETTLTNIAQPANRKITVVTAMHAKSGDWICLAGPDTIYREIGRIGKKTGGPDTIHLIARVVSGPFYPTATRVLPAQRIEYHVKTSPKTQLSRNWEGADVALGQHLDSLDIILKDKLGAPLAGPASGATFLTVVFGGYVGKNANRIFMAESTDVNIRNCF